MAQGMYKFLSFLILYHISIFLINNIFVFFCITIYSFEVNTPCSVTASAKHLTNGLSKLLLNHPKLHMRFKLRLYSLQLCTLQCFKKLSLIDVLIPMRADVKKMFSISSSYEGVFFLSQNYYFQCKT